MSSLDTFDAINKIPAGERVIALMREEIAATQQAKASASEWTRVDKAAFQTLNEERQHCGARCECPKLRNDSVEIRRHHGSCTIARRLQ